MDFTGEDIFEKDNLCTEPIDTDAIQEEASESVDSLIDSLVSSKLSADMLEKHTDIKRRIDTSKDILKRLNIMLASNDIAHRMIIKGIESNPSIASLYRSLVEIQRSILSIQEQKSKVISDITGYLKELQLEIPFSDDEEDEEVNIHTTRGAKEFIKKIIEEDD